MSDIPNLGLSVPQSGAPDPASTPVKATAATAGLAASASVDKEKEVSTSTRIKGMGELKAKAPKVYDKMMEGIGQTIIKQMERSEERRKKSARESLRR